MFVAERLSLLYSWKCNKAKEKQEGVCATATNIHKMEPIHKRWYGDRHRRKRRAEEKKGVLKRIEKILDLNNFLESMQKIHYIQKLTKSANGNRWYNGAVHSFFLLLFPNKNLHWK